MEIEPIIMPERELLEVKFVQVYLLDNNLKQPILRYNSPDDKDETKKHMTLLGRILDEVGIKKEIVELSRNQIGINPKTDRYELCGAGRFNFKEGLFTFYGLSVDYKIKTDEGHLKDIQTRKPRFNFKVGGLFI